MVRHKTLRHDSRGGVKIKLFFVLILLLAGGFGGWYFFFREEKPKEAKKEENAIPCKSKDTTLCTYITSWHAPEEYRFTVKETRSGSTETSVFEYNFGEPAKIRAKLANGQETITIGNTLYTKSGSVWRKQTLGAKPAASQNDSAASDVQQVEEDITPIKPDHYKAIGEEPCGKLNCHQYQFFDPDNSGTKQFIWFDDTDFRLRRLRFETGGTISEQTFEYVSVDISEPSPVQAAHD